MNSGDRVGPDRGRCHDHTMQLMEIIAGLRHTNDAPGYKTKDWTRTIQTVDKVEYENSYSVALVLDLVTRCEIPYMDMEVVPHVISRCA